MTIKKVVKPTELSQVKIGDFDKLKTYLLFSFPCTFYKLVRHDIENKISGYCFVELLGCDKETYFNSETPEECLSKAISMRYDVYEITNKNDLIEFLKMY